MVVSNCTSAEVRRTKLSPLFINLISDQSRWVSAKAAHINTVLLHAVTQHVIYVLTEGKHGLSDG